MAFTDFLFEHQRTTTSSPVNAMTVDVEDYFQVSAFEPHVDSWEHYPYRVEQNTNRILELFDQHDVHATFFTLGWIAERSPRLLRQIVDQGHEVASHGYQHTRVTQQTPEEFRADVSGTKVLLEDTIGQPVQGYRAASFSIGARNLWALKILQECGYRYSSSIYPIKHDLYGMPEAPRFAFRLESDGILEVPITTVHVLGRKYPCGGGGFFRLLPYNISRWALRRVNQNDRQPCVFYFHPWEIDVRQPRITGVTAKARFRHYLNLSKTESRLAKLLADFNWGRMDQIYPVTPDK